MKKIKDIEFFDVTEISKRFHEKITINEIRKYFEENKIKGKNIDNEWYADNKSIEDFMQILQEERAITIGPIEIDLSGVEMEGRILDIGGGGEAVIAQFKGEDVIAIDYKKSELEEAPKTGALNIIMDAKDLKFLDNTFNSVSAFFTLMYIPLKDHKKIFQEIHRVLKLNCEFFLWDLIIPKKTVKDKDIYVVMLKVKINEKIIDSGYGVMWNKEQDAISYLKLGESVGFNVLEQKIEENVFYIRFKKVKN